MTEKAIEAAAKAMCAAGCMEMSDALDFHEMNESEQEMVRRIVSAAIAAYEAALWRPIEEHNGSEDEELLAWNPEWSGTYFVRYDLDDWYVPDAQIDEPWCALASRPTHFRPLPVPPGKESA
jgi:hypothetical protein